MSRTLTRVAKAALGLALSVIAIVWLVPAPAGGVAIEHSEVVAKAEPPRDPIREWVELRLAGMSLEDRVRSLFIHHVAGQNPDAMRALTTPVEFGGFGAAGFILMGDNIPDGPDELARQVQMAVAEPDLPPIVAVDEEGGEVQRLAFDPYPGANYLRDASNQEVTDAFAARGALLASLGINVNFGVVADVTSDPRSFIFSRTLGNDAASASERVAAAVTAESSSVGTTLKHFPGHGRTAADSHNGVPSTGVSFDEWLATDAVPFKVGIDAGAGLVMFGHLAFTAVDSVPASLSPAWHQILRDDLGFTGIIVTDDLRMLQDSGDPSLSDPYANVVAALNAGNDALLYVLPADPQAVGIDREALVYAVLNAVESGQIETSRVDDAATRLLTFRRTLAPGATTWQPPCDPGCLLGGWFGAPISSYIAGT